MKSELYTLRHLPNVLIVAILAVMMAGISAVLQWALPFLLKIDPPQVGDSPTGQQVQALIDGSDPTTSSFQLAALDITGSGQSTGISIFLIAIVALTVTAASYPFSSGAVVWKVVGAGSRMKWVRSLIAAVLSTVLLVCVAACVLNSLIALVAAPMNDVSLVASASNVAVVWLRGSLAVLLLTLAIIGVVLAIRRIGPAIGVIVAVLMAGVILGTIGVMAGWEPYLYSWLPSSAVSIAGGQGATQTMNPWVGIAVLAGWSVVSMGLGLTRFYRANL
ncbi:MULTISPECIES: hypothetical protein [unclassified Corynebacterium]|uniref:hypothetical protein n=1 Tax=unclassified Corynebacterium TaxID=2624378 RepID=UPI0008A5974A|nr:MULTISPECIES: hypothetical protein [unclassified Corynebacterium]MDK8897262.1 hypothetical protein [Corynebacterium sp. MSK004]OFP89053.1 hypothetical protein HMPREF2967_00565 [Corynebacterium sp. HMSC059E07]